MCDKTVQLCEELETLAKASPLSNIISDSIAQKIAMPKNYFSDRSHLVSENFGFDEETPELFNSEEDSSIQETTSLDSEHKETEEDDLEIPAFLRRQKN